MGGIADGGAAPVVLQQVNLYRATDGAGKLGSGTRLLLLAAAAVISALVLVAAVGEYHLAGMQEQRVAVGRDLSERRAALARLRDSLRPRDLDPFLEAELSALRLRQRHLNDSLAALARQQSPDKTGFSVFFAGLARNPVDGLWFRSVALSAGGEQVVLRGQTLDPALVPQLLQRLAGEQAFIGRTFRRASLQRGSDDADTRVVDFELRSAEAGELHDAG